jgi:hypothetical protein
MKLPTKALSYRRPSRSFRPMRGGTAAALSVLLGASVLAAVAPAQALDAARVGPSDPNNHGFPAYYTDDSGVALQMCDDGTGACLGSTPASLAPVEGENFYWMATTDLSAPGLDISVEIAAEAAWLSPTQPITFDRLRIRGHSDIGDVTVNHPYGTVTVPAGDTSAVRNINFTEDIGCNPVASCNFAEMATSADAHITDWIVSTTPPAGRVGDGVTSEPATVGGVPATITAGGASTAEWVVMGKLADPNAVSLPTALDFGNVRQAVTKTVRLKNLGTKALAINTVALSRSATLSRLASSTCKPGLSLGIGRSCTVELRYRPNGSKQSSEVLTINSHKVRVSAQTAAVMSAPQRVHFRAVQSGASGKTRRVVVANTGSLPLKIGRVRLAGKSPSSFDIRSGAPKVCARGVSVRPGKECAVYVGFEPKGFGPKSANLVIGSNAIGRARSIALSGSGR